MSKPGHSRFHKDLGRDEFSKLLRENGTHLSVYQSQTAKESAEEWRGNTANAAINKERVKAAVKQGMITDVRGDNSCFDRAFFTSAILNSTNLANVLEHFLERFEQYLRDEYFDKLSSKEGNNAYLNEIMQNIFQRDANKKESQEFQQLINAKRYAANHIKEEFEQLIALAKSGEISKQDVLDKMNKDSVFDLALVMSLREAAMSINYENEVTKNRLRAINEGELKPYLNGQNIQYAHYFFHHPNCQACEELYAATAAVFGVEILNTNYAGGADREGSFVKKYPCIEGDEKVARAEIFSIDGRHYKAISQEGYEVTSKEKRGLASAHKVEERRPRASGIFDLRWDADRYNAITSPRSWLKHHSIAILNHEIFAVSEREMDVNRFSIIGSRAHLFKAIWQFQESSTAQKLTTVVNVGHHWVALHFRKTEQGIIAQYADSLQSGKKAPANIQEILKALAVKEIEPAICEKQRDGHSCGYHALFNAMKMHQSTDLTQASEVTDCEGNQIANVKALVDRGFPILRDTTTAAATAAVSDEDLDDDGSINIARIVESDNHAALQQHLFPEAVSSNSIEALKRIANFRKKLQSYVQSILGNYAQLQKVFGFFDKYDFDEISRNLVAEYVENEILNPLANFAETQTEFLDEIIARSFVNINQTIELIADFEELKLDIKAAAASISEDEINAKKTAAFAKKIQAPTAGFIDQEGSSQQNLLMYLCSTEEQEIDAQEFHNLIQAMNQGRVTTAFFGKETNLTPLQVAIFANNSTAVNALLGQENQEDARALILAKNADGSNALDSIKSLIKLKGEETNPEIVKNVIACALQNLQFLKQNNAEIEFKISELLVLLRENDILDQEKLQNLREGLFESASEVDFDIVSEFSQEEDEQAPYYYATSGDPDFDDVALSQFGFGTETFVGVAQGEAATNPKKFLSGAFKDIAKDHEKCQASATLCAAIASYDAANQRISIATSHLGKSRATVVIKFVKPDGSFEYRSVALTNDHTIYNQDTAEYIENKGWNLSEEDIEQRIFGLIGGAEFKDEVIRKPDLKTFSAKEILEIIKEQYPDLANASVLDLDLVLSSEPIPADIQLNSKREVVEEEKNEYEKNEYEKTLSSARKNYEELVFEGSINPKQFSFAQFLNQEFNQANSYGVVAMPLYKDARLLLQEGSPIIAAVSNGFGQGLEMPREATVADYKNALQGKGKSQFGEAVLASSVASQLYVAAQVRAIEGLEPSLEYQPHFYKMIMAQQNIAREMAAAKAAAAAAEPRFASRALPEKASKVLPVNPNFREITLADTIAASDLLDKARQIKDEERINRERLTIDKSDFYKAEERREAAKTGTNVALKSSKRKELQSILLTPEDIQFVSCAGQDFGSKLVAGEVGAKSQAAIDSSTYIKLEGKYKDIFQVNQGYSDKSFQAYFASFGGMYFKEEPNNNADGSPNTTKPKIFGKACLFRAHFRNCVFENIDFSEMDPKIFVLMRVDYLTCNFINCKYPRGIVMSDKNTPKLDDAKAQERVELAKAELDNASRNPNPNQEQQASIVQSITRRLLVAKDAKAAEEFKDPASKVAPLSVGKFSRPVPIHDHGKVGGRENMPPIMTH